MTLNDTKFLHCNDNFNFFFYFSQNHGSRLTPILDNKESLTPLEIVSTSTELVQSKNGYPRMKPKKVHTHKMEYSKSQRPGNDKKRRFGHRNRIISNRLNLSHPYLENSSDVLTLEYMNNLNETLGLRRAFSDINISSSRSEFTKEFCDSNRNSLNNEKFDETTISVTDQDFLKLMFTKGCVT